MKINKQDPKHWFYLILFTMNVFICLLIRPFIKKQNTIILYGHKFNGNLKAIYDYANIERTDIQLLFLTMDPTYSKKLKNEQIKTILAISPSSILYLAKTKLIISDHGLHSLVFLLKFSDMKFADVWHSIPFKGFDSDDFKVQHRYNEIWVSSPVVKELYVKKYGFSASKVYVTGYARTDRLVHQSNQAIKIKQDLGIRHTDCKIILFAPTWQQDEKKRNIYPFGLDERLFLDNINQFCEATDSICIIRKHLNSPLTELQELSRVYDCSYQLFPDTETILFISDILVYDWSSIAFDYLILGRPTLALDTPAPFAKGFSLGPEYRFGELVKSPKELFENLEHYLINPEAYLNKHALTNKRIADKIYEKNADGLASKRCYQRAEKLLH